MFNVVNFSSFTNFFVNKTNEDFEQEHLNFSEQYVKSSCANYRKYCVK